MKIKYEPHPVSPERKAELRSQGFKILDARFAPEDETPEGPTRENIAKMARWDVVDLLEVHGVPESDCEGVEVDELRKKLIQTLFVEA
tara:strand:- start:15686 stop:15949 length:264 start_codon:yes stop_codon:yes gene_type:complete